jgi:tetratricopeptide (TPR) repeat protein
LSASILSIRVFEHEEETVLLSVRISRALVRLSLSPIAALIVAIILALLGHNPAAAQQSIFERHIDRPGFDYRSFNMQKSDPKGCERACLLEPQCKAWTYVRPGIQGNQARCWLKASVPRGGPSRCCDSGIIVGRPASAKISPKNADKEDYDRAIAKYTEAIRRDPAFAPSYRDRAIAYEKLGRRAEAIADYRKALLLDSSDRPATEGLARLGAKPF